MNFLFWNTYKNELINNTLLEIILDNDISVVILAEYIADINQIINMLAKYGITMHQYCLCERIKVISSVENVKLIVDASRYTILVLNDKDILCCVHLNSKLCPNHESTREILMEQIMNDIKECEEKFNTKNSIIVGDFNINPYENSCIDARYFHGIPICCEAERGSRTIAGVKFDMFYNPMWNFFGDFDKPYGTYYYNDGSSRNTYWNIFDQVIFRPVLKKRFLKDKLNIITETSSKFLLDEKGHPNKDISDHLPIVFGFKEED